jgi:ubiquitin C-terminal hydrolase
MDESKKTLKIETPNEINNQNVCYTNSDMNCLVGRKKRIQSRLKKHDFDIKDSLEKV